MSLTSQSLNVAVSLTKSHMSKILISNIPNASMKFLQYFDDSHVPALFILKTIKVIIKAQIFDTAI